MGLRSRRVWVWVLLGASAGIDAAAAAPRRPNVVVLLSDDHAHSALGCAGRAATRKLILHLRSGQRELFDLAADPLELRNLAGRPELAALEAELFGRLVHAVRRERDPAGRDLLEKTWKSTEP